MATTTGQEKREPTLDGWLKLESEKGIPELLAEMDASMDVLNERMDVINAIHEIYEELFGKMMTGDGDY